MSLEYASSSVESDIFPKKILGYDFELHPEKEFNMMDHLNPAPIELMGVLSEKEVQAYIGDIVVAFPDISHAQINAIIQRESGGVPDPDKGSQDQKWGGVMQLAEVAYDDMIQLGATKYLDIFHKISPSVLIHLDNKFPEFVASIRKIQSLDSRSPKRIQEEMIKIKEYTKNSIKANNPELNILMGVIHLDSINSVSQKKVSRPSEKEVTLFSKIIDRMHRITPDVINPLLVSKNFAPIPESEFRKTIDDIIQNKEKFQKFYTNYLYSVGTGRTESIVPAGIQYGLVTTISADQIDSRNSLSA